MLVMEYGDLMADKIFLEVPDGAVWPVKLTRPCNGEIWLQKGWPEFAKFYSLKHGCLLFFRYGGEHSHFRVRIFMRNTLEMKYFSSSTDDEAEGNSNPSSETEGQGNKHDRDLALRTFAKTELEDLAYSKALSFKSNNPFLCDENASIILINSPVSVPFANKQICARGVSLLQISNDERSWAVKCITTVYKGRSRTRFHNFGWGPFVKDNHLEEGDACVLELITKGPAIR
ncbi:PREDICTED: B3 domain-containing protein Os03g0212300-like isoform X1 [Prunus mume]|uniref:B3 domain-containing protein Os03g0212300-like isoform X1 n=1 Tax=Prunus mume TaxID=102107 RepID=A0ABM0PM43_PRUMU|nr:PREDICTED: B3 domain-containing protein Os03g0212300-like isoform X1 [Prunus mume]